MRILYLCHVDWAWIKQRPQFLAEAIGREGAVVDVRYVPGWRRGIRTAGVHSAARRMPHLPPATRWIRWTLNPWLRRIWLSLTGGRPDVVWLTHPALVSSLPRRLRHRLVYDAMDLAPAFPGVDAATVARLEQVLLGNALLCFATSTRIRQELQRVRSDVRVRLLRNALDGERQWPATTDSPHHAIEDGRGDGRPPVVLYAGTVSSWFDVEAVAALRAQRPDTVIRIVGPVEPAMRRRLDPVSVEFAGAVPHSSLPDELARADVLVMPFTVTPLVEGVDPVKLYEYVAMRRPVVSVWYAELEHFHGFVHFYRTPEEFAATVDRCLGASSSHDPARVAAFVEQNTWSVRAREAVHELHAALEEERRSAVPTDCAD